jgi:hypothetical protein
MQMLRHQNERVQFTKSSIAASSNLLSGDVSERSARQESSSLRGVRRRE